jgi:probable selenium-dependent hydroxylase accessory protein YqeC
MDGEQKELYSVIEKHVKEEGRRTIPLKEALGLRERDLISLVGAGGKTTLMFRLANELHQDGKTVITTTTTKILEPSASEAPHLFVHPDEERTKEFVDHYLQKHRHLTLAQEKLESGKLEGVSSGLILSLWTSSGSDYLIVEADGAAGRPIKAPREWEPVVPEGTTLVIAILGMDGIERVLNGENVFQAERVAMITGLSLGMKITDEAISVLITHPEGVFKGSPLSSRRVAVLNKVDLPGGIAKARGVARKVIEKSHGGIERIVLGQMNREPPIVEVIFP